MKTIAKRLIDAALSRFTHKSFFGALLLSTICILVSPTVDANIIDDTYGSGAGSFENGTFVDSGGYYMVLPVGSTTITGWTVGGPGGVDWVSAPYFGTNSGLRAIDLIESSVGSISIVIPTIIGQTYDLSFYTATYSTGNALGAVSAGSLVNKTFSAPISLIQDISNPNYAPLNFQFMANGTDTTINFMSTPTGSSCLPDCVGPIIDTVSVSAASQASIPIPSTLWLVGAGLVGLFGFSPRKLSGSIRHWPRRAMSTWSWSPS